MVLEGDGDTVLENARSSLTFSVRAEYIYSAASHASCLDGVLILHDFHKVLKRAGTGDFKV
jgi:hypothetical protein